MKNGVQNGKVIELTASRQLSSGDGYLQGSVFAVATADVANGAVGEFLTETVVSLPKTSAQAWAQGDQIYWDDTNHRLDNTNVGRVVGVATSVAANPSATGSIKLPEAVLPPQSAHVASVATVNASDLATSEALANANKVAINAILTALQNAGLMAAS